MADDGVGKLHGQVALVTGAGSGIGRATAALFAREGAAVLCADRSAASAAETAQLIQRDGGRAAGIQADVRLAADAERMVAGALETFGAFDVLFNNAGGGRVRGKVHELSEDDWDLVLDTNLKGVFLCSRAALPVFLQRGRGVIVNTASSYGVLAAPDRPAYCSAKAGIIMLTRQMALDYGPGIRVNCVCPGATATPPMLQSIESAPDPEARRRQLSLLNRALGRLGEPDEIARAVLFLASDDSSFITGHALVIDGGQTTDA